MKQYCLYCDNRFEESILLKDKEGDFICPACKEVEELGATGDECECCGEYTKNEDFKNVVDDNNIPYDYICPACYDDWADLFYKGETEESMMPGKI